jgi:hypothetical protein
MSHLLSPENVTSQQTNPFDLKLTGKVCRSETRRYRLEGFLDMINFQIIEDGPRLKEAT